MGASIDQFKESARKRGFKNLKEAWQQYSSNMSALEKQQLVLELSKDQPWWWKEIIDDFLSTHDVTLCMPILEKVVEKGGLWIGLMHFNQRCSDDPDFATKCLSHLSKITGQNALDFSCIILAYSLSKNKERWDILRNRFASPSSDMRYSTLLAGRILINMGHEPDLEYLKALHELATREIDRRINKELSWDTVLTYHLIPDSARKTLNRLLRLRDVFVASELLTALSWKNKVPFSLRFELVEILSLVEDKNIEGKIARCIATFGDADVDTSLQVIRKIASRNHYSIYGDQAWTCQQLGKSKLKESLEVVKSWTREELDYVEKYGLHRFFIPDVLMELTTGDRDALISCIEELSEEESNDRLVMTTIREYMKNVPKKRWRPTNKDDEKRLDQCIYALEKIAVRSGKPKEKFPRVKERIFRIGQLIELIQNAEHIPQPALVKQGLKKFPNINRFISVSLKGGKLKPLPFLSLLGTDRCDYKEYVDRVKDAKKEKNKNKQTVMIYQARDALYYYGLLSHLDNCLTSIRKTEYGTKELRAKLLHENENQFQSAISEIEVISRLRQQLPLTIAEVAPTKEGKGAKRPDIMVKVLGLPMHVEVITPEMAAVLRYLGGGGIPNRLVGKILDEFEKHFKDLADDFPALIVADLSHSEIDYLSADTAMSGSLAVSMLWDNKSRQVVAEYPTRAKDAISLRAPETSKLLGLIVYKRIITKEGHIILRGRCVINPFSTENKNVPVCKVVGDVLLDIVD